MQPAYTVLDSQNKQSIELIIAHRKLRALPHGMAALKQLRSLDASDNPISNINAEQLPAHITELTLTGCQLDSVPACLSNLTRLQQLHLAANNISQAEAVFACPCLTHAGLSFNHISSLVTSQIKIPARSAVQPESASLPRGSRYSSMVTSNPQQQRPTAASELAGNVPGNAASATSSCAFPCSCLMSLDLSRNDITDLPALLAALKQLSQLKSLSLHGNPVSLLPHYRDAVLEHLPQLLYLDGQKLGSISTSSTSSRPGTGGSKRRPVGARPGSASANSSSTSQQEQTAAAAPAQVPLLVFLELNRQQLDEAFEQACAALATRSVRKQQQWLHRTAADGVNNFTTADAGSKPESVSACSGDSATVEGPSVSMTGKQGSSTAPGATTADVADTPGAAADDSTVVAVPAAPLKPITYHMELEAPDGSIICSLPLVVQPPKPHGAEPAIAMAAAAPADSKKGLAKAGKQAPTAAKPRPGSVKGPTGKGRAAVDNGSVLAGATTSAAQLMQGSLLVQLKLPVTVAGRDWLTTGFLVKVFRTQQDPVAAVPQQLVSAATTPAPAAAASTGSKRVPSASGKPAGSNSKTGKQIAASTGNGTDSLPHTTLPLIWQYEMNQSLLGTARVVAGDLLDSFGQQQVFEGKADFMPPAPLFNTTTGTLLSVKDATSKQLPVASCRYKLVLHHQNVDSRITNDNSGGHCI